MFGLQMGSCGCSEIPADWTLPGPDGGVYTVHLCTPCTYCETPGGVVLSLLTDPEDIEMFTDGVPEMKLDPVIGVGFPVLDLFALRKLIKAQCIGMGNETEEIVSDAEMAEMICDQLDANAVQMVSETFREFKGHVARNTAGRTAEGVAGRTLTERLEAMLTEIEGRGWQRADCTLNTIENGGASDAFEFCAAYLRRILGKPAQPIPAR